MKVVTIPQVAKPQARKPVDRFAGKPHGAALTGAMRALAGTYEPVTEGGLSDRLDLLTSQLDGAFGDGEAAAEPVPAGPKA